MFSYRELSRVIFLCVIILCRYKRENKTTRTITDSNIYIKLYVFRLIKRSKANGLLRDYKERV